MKDLSGQRFGMLLVSSKWETKEMKRMAGSYTVVKWLVRCDCGKEFWTRSSGLLSGKTKSCGCLRRKRFSEFLTAGGTSRYPLGDKTIRAYYAQYAETADRRGVQFELSYEQFKGKVTSDCYYCGAAPRTDVGPRRRKGEEHVALNGVDRIDSSSGYTDEGTVCSCKDCNYAKRKLSVDEFINLCRRVAHKSNDIADSAAKAAA